MNGSSNDTCSKNSGNFLYRGYRVVLITEATAVAVAPTVAPKPILDPIVTSPSPILSTAPLVIFIFTLDNTGSMIGVFQQHR